MDIANYLISMEVSKITNAPQITKDCASSLIMEGGKSKLFLQEEII